MYRHVIKGRGEHRGKYLCRKTPCLSGEDRYTWHPEQRQAERWDPGYGDTYAKRVAVEHNGHFVKLVAPNAVAAAVPKMLDFILAHAFGAKERPSCYLVAHDQHCWECATKAVDALHAKDPAAFAKEYGECETPRERHDAAIESDGDEFDSLPMCTACGAPLAGYLTEYGVDQELDALTGECAPGLDDADGWADIEAVTCDLEHDDPRWRKIARVIERARRAEKEQAR